MALIPRIDAVIAADENNVHVIREILAAFSQTLPATIDEAAGLYETAARCFSEGLEANEHFRPMIDLWERESFESWDQVEALAALDTNAHQLLAEFRSREIRGLLLGRIGALFSTGMADFLRMRVASPLFHQRIQVESLGLMKLMLDDPKIACAWRQLFSEDEGKRFFRENQPKLTPWLEKFNLKRIYNRASEVAMHSRFAGAALGLRTNTRFEGNRFTYEVLVAHQEFNPDHPHLLVLEVIYMLRVQQRIFEGLPSCAPEITDPLFLETRLPRYRSNVDALFREMLRQYPHLGQA
jgi:hypothetical protein